MQRFKDEGPRIRTPTAGRVCGGQAIGTERAGRKGWGGWGRGARRAGVRRPQGGRSPAAVSRGGRSAGPGSDAKDEEAASSGRAPPARRGSAP